MSAPPFAGIVLAGGAGRRLGGVDKPMLEVGGRTLLSRALDALAAADPVVVVGPRRPGVDRVHWTREEPAGAGPVAALAAGLSTVDTPVVVVLAGDLVGVTTATVRRLVGVLGDTAHDGAVLVDDGGRRQWLVGAWRTEAVRGVLPAEPAGAALRTVLGALTIAEVPARGGEAADVDTPEDL